MDKKLMLNDLQSHFNFKKDTEFADFLGISGQLLSKWKSRNTYDVELLYTKCTDVNPEWLLTGEGSMLKKEQEHILHEPPVIYKTKSELLKEKQSIPLYNVQATASIVSLFKDSSTTKPVDHISIPNLPKCDGAIYVSGDSMYPLLKSGDIIMYKKLTASLENIFWGEMYLVSLANDDGDEFVMVKWIHKSDNGVEWIKLVSENRHHQPKDFHLKNVKGLALIKASVRINSMY